MSQFISIMRSFTNPLIKKYSCAFSVLALLSGCGNIVSSSGPSRAKVMKAASGSNELGIRVVDLDDHVVSQILTTQKSGFFFETLGDGLKKTTVVGTGDILDVTIWEAPPAALFGSAAAAAGFGASDPVSKATTLPQQRVGQDGRIIIPFAGAVPVTGRTTTEIQADIVRRLSGKAHQPQAIVRIAANATSVVTVMGEVGGSLRMPLTDRGERLLDAIAAAGGVRQPANKITIQITRGNLVRSMPLDRVVADPRQNIVLQSDDVVMAIFQPFSFTSLGATGRNEELPFEASGITLAQALGRVGGLQDQRSDPRGVFIFRFEDPAALGITNLSGIATTEDKRIPVIYRVDLKNPASFFLAQNFQMRDKDVMYSSNAPLADIQKFVTIASSIVYPIISIQTATRN